MDLRFGEEKSATGTATASYVDAMTLGIAPIKSTSFIIENTHATLTLKYKVLIYRNIGGTYEEEYVAEATIQPLGQDTVNISADLAISKAVLQVKDGTGHATYAVEGIQLRGGV